jgi:hypothetical protein
MTASISVSFPEAVWSAVRIVGGAGAERRAPLARELRAGRPARLRGGLTHVRHRRSQIVGSGVRGGDLQQEEASDDNGHRVAD